MRNLSHNISTATIANILREHGIEPAPDRKCQSTWKTFLKTHWDVLAPVDFTTIEIWTKDGLATVYLLFVMELASPTTCRAEHATSPALCGSSCLYNDLWHG
jgi:putative transposase